MAENPVLKEAKQRGLISSPVHETAGAGQSAVSGSSNPVLREYFGEAAATRAEKQAQIINKAREAASAAPDANGGGGKVGNVLKGAAKGTASGWVNTGGTLLDLMNRVSAKNSSENRRAAQEADNAARYREMLASGKMADGTPIDAAKRAQLEMLAQRAERNAGIYREANENIHSHGAEAAQNLYGTADKLAAESEKHITAAKKDTGKVGDFLVDLGVAGTQLAGDALTGGLVATGIRTFGSGAREARQSGATLGQQVGYGAGSAAVGVLTEKIANVAGPFKKAFGSGVLDDALAKVAAKPAGMLAVSALSEGLEEGAEALVQPLLQKLTYNPDAAYDADWVADTLYSMAIGGALGGAGGGIDVATSGRGQNLAPWRSGETQIAQNEGKVTPAQKENAEGLSGDIMIAEARRLSGQNKTAPTMGAAWNENGLSALTEQEKTNLSSGKRNKVVSNFNEAVGFIKNALKNKQVTDRAYLGKVPDAVAQRVLADTGVNISGFNAVLPSDAVRHMFKHHGDPLMEAARGQVSLTPEAVAEIPSILSEPDKVYLSDKTDARGRKILMFEKQIGNYYITAQAVSDGTHSLQTDTLYIQKKNSHDTGSNAGASTDPAHNARSVPPQSSSNNSVPGNGQNVNVENMDPLLKLMMDGKRVDQSKASNEQFAAFADRGDIGVDAAGKMFRIDPEQHIDRRGMDTVGSRKVNAFQFDHPQLHSYFQRAAGALIADADLSLQFGLQRNVERTVHGKKMRQQVQTSQHLRRAMDETGLSRNEIIDAAQRIVNDKGQENVKAAKQVEIILDDMLTYGWKPMVGGEVAPNDAYIRAKNEIAGSQPAAEDGHGLDGVGAANAGSLNSDFENLQAQSSRFHPEGPYAARPVDVPTQDFDGRNIPKSASTVMGAQGTPDPAVLQLEQMIADGELSFDTITDKDSVRRAQNTMAEKGFDGALEQYRQAVNSGVATKDNTTLGQQLLLAAMRSGNVQYTAELLTLYTRNSTNAAQALQAQSIFRKLSPEGQLVAMQKAVDALNEKYGTDVEIDEADVADFMEAETDEARQEVEKRIVKKAARAVPGTFKGKYDTIRYLAMLGNPRTHIRNILGNTLFQVPVAVKNRVGAAAEIVGGVVSRGKTERTKSLFGANPFGTLAAEARADWVNVKDFLSQNSKYNEGNATLSAIEQEAHAFSDDNLLGRGVNKAADFNSRLLEAEDTAAKRLIYAQSLAGYLKANGCKSMADADAALLNKARVYAADEALRNTFNDKNAVSSAVSMLGRASKSENPALRTAGYVVEGALPFKRTPANILVRAAEYSPVGAALGTFDTIRGAKSGDTAEIAKGLDRLAAGLTGTGLMALGALAAGNGWVRGREDEDEKQAAFDDLTGHQDYALELKDGTSVTLDWLAPEAIPFFMGVELYNAALDGGLSVSELGDTLKNATAPMLELSMLQGLNDIFDNAAYAKYSGGSVMGSIVTSALSSYVTQVVPTIGGQIERSAEDVRMTTYTEKDGELSTDMQYTLGKVSQKVPGWDYRQIPYIDAWGREEETGDPLERAAKNLFNPAYVSQIDVDKVEHELQRLADATGETGIFPERAEKSITGKDGKDKNFTADEYVAYAKDLGQTSYKLVQAGMNTAAYRSMSNTEKAEYLNDLFSYAGAAARAKAGGKELEGWKLNAKNAQKDLGVSTAEYIALYQKYGSSYLSGNGYEKTKAAADVGLSVDEYIEMKTGANTDGKSGITKAEAMAALDGHPKRVDLWDIICTTNAKNPYV